jgi:hypothetical protein
MDFPVNLHEYVLGKLEAAKGEWRTVAERTGVPYDTIYKIASQTTENPGIKHIQALADYFLEREAA